MLEQHEQELLEYGIDYQDAMDRFDGEAELYEDFVFRFLEDDKYGQVVEALEAGDVEAAHRAAHTLKGVVGNLSFTNYFRQIGAMSDSLKNNDLEIAKSFLPGVKDAHNQVMQILQKYQP